MNELNGKFDNVQVIDFLKNLDSRISRIESKLGIDSVQPDLDTTHLDLSSEESLESQTLESRLGEYWFANFGIVILAISLILLLILPFKNSSSFLPSMLSFVVTGLIFYLAHSIRSSYSYISNYLVGTALIFLFFSVLRFFHFSNVPIFSDKSYNTMFSSQMLEIGLLIVVAILSYLISTKRNSAYLTALSLIMASAVGLVANSNYLVFILNTVVAIAFSYVYIKKDWNYILLFGMGICYFSHFVWALNDPFIGNPLKLVLTPDINLIFILLYSIIFAIGNLIKNRGLEENNISISNSMMNVTSSFLLFHLMSFNLLKEGYIVYEMIFFIVLFTISILFWVYNNSKYSPTSYSLVAFIALSIAIIATIAVPDVFIYLIWQSILVTIISVWYKSKTLTFANFIIFCGLFFIYLFTTETFTLISLSFGIVGLINARILNWQKLRLTLQTEMMRNAYLAIAFFSIPFTLLKSLPSNYIGLSWLAVAIIYYILSIVLKTFKYKWMAHLTLLATIFYVIVFGLSSLDNTYKIVTLFSIGIVTVIISVLSTNLNRKLTSDNKVNQ